MSVKSNLGKFGEKIAVQYLERRNYEIIGRNYRCRAGEIDIIAKKDYFLVFIEVKTRSNVIFGEPVESINNEKAEKIRKIADYYIAINGVENAEVRFDIITVQKFYKKIVISHFKNAF